MFKGFFEYEYKITPFFKLLITPRLRTLDLHRIKNDNDIYNVLHLATIKSPVKEEKRLPSYFFLFLKFNFQFSTWKHFVLMSLV